MAVSVSTASTIPCLNSDTSTRLTFSSSSSWRFRSSSSSFLQFHQRIGTRGLSSPSPRTRILPLVRILLVSLVNSILQFVGESKEANFSSFDDLLAKSDKPVLVDFYATWCGPCQFMVPILNEVGVSLSDKIQVVKIDTEKYPSIADKYQIEALPTFIIFKDGKPCHRFEGAMNAAQLIQQIEDALKNNQ